MNDITLSDLFGTGQAVLESSFTPAQIALSLSMTLIIVLLIYALYKYTYNGVLYSKNFNLTLVITALVVNAVMIGISGNIVLSLGLVGALSIVRFRTAVKDPKDTAFLFWAITIGVINGVAYYELAWISSIFIGGVIIALSKFVVAQVPYVLILQYSGSFDALAALLNTNTHKWHVRTDALKGDHTEKVIEVQLKQDNQEQMLHEVRSQEQVHSAILLASNGSFPE